MSDERRGAAPSIDDSDVVIAPALALPGVRHAFFTRRGGVSRGLYASLNMGLGSKDALDDVRENRSRAADFLGLAGGEIATPSQIHSSVAVTIDRPFGAERPKADGIATATPGLAIGVLSADCGPILFADAKARVVGAAHAGWRGAASGIAEATIAAMETLGSRRGDIVAVLGPTITQANYEVGADMADEVLAEHPQAGRFLAAGVATGKHQFDLSGFIVWRLEAAGVSAGFIGRCTYGEEDRFFSFRRTTHRGETDYGRQLAAITIEE